MDAQVERARAELQAPDFESASQFVPTNNVV
jgi:hypothetical protein